MATTSTKEYLEALRTKQNSSFLGDLPKFANIGARQFVGSLGTIPEAIGAATGRPKLQQTGQEFRQGQEKVIQEKIVPTLSREGKKVFNAGIEDVFKGNVGVGKFVLGKSAQFLPTTLAGGVAGAGIRGAVPQLSRGVAFATGEALVTAPSGASRQASEIDAAPSNVLLQNSKAYQRAYAQHADKPENLRDAIARAATKAEALPTGALSSAAATIAGSVVASRLTKGGAGGVFGAGAETAMGVLKGASQGARREAVQEAAQSFSESIAGDLTTANFTDPSAAKIDSLMKNAALAAAEGALLGSSLGASIGAVQGRLNKMTADRIQAADKKVAEAQSLQPTKPSGDSGSVRPVVTEEQKVQAAEVKDSAVEDIAQAAKAQADANTLEGIQPVEGVKQKSNVLSEMSRSDLVEEAKQAGIQFKGISSEQLRVNLQVSRDAASGVKSPEVDRFNMSRELDSVGDTIGTAVPKKLRKQLLNALSGVETAEEKLSILDVIQEMYKNTRSIAVEDTFTELRKRLSENAVAPSAVVEEQIVQQPERLEEITDGPAPRLDGSSAFVPFEVIQARKAPVAEESSSFTLPEFSTVAASNVRIPEGIPQQTAPVQTAQVEAPVEDTLPLTTSVSKPKLLEFKQEKPAEEQVLNAPEELEVLERTSKLDRPLTVEERIVEAASIDDAVREAEDLPDTEGELTQDQVTEFSDYVERFPDVAERYVRIGIAKKWTNEKVLAEIRKNIPAKNVAAETPAISQEEQTLRNIEASQDSVKRKKEQKSTVSEAEAAREELKDISASLREMSAADDLFDVLVDSAVDAYFTGTTKQAKATELKHVPDVRAVTNKDLRVPGNKMTADGVRGVLSDLLPGNAVNVRVVSDIKALPKSAKEYLKSKGLEDTARGLYIPGKTRKDDAIYVISKNISSPQEATFVLLHEAVHRGLRTVFGAKLSLAMEKVYSANAKVKEAVDARMKSQKISKAEATEEILADMAREGRARNLKLWEKIVAFINNWIKGRLGKSVTMEMSDRQVEELVSGAQSIGLEADVEVVGGDVPGKASDIRTSLRFSDGPAQAMDRTEGLLRDAKEFVDARVPSITGWLHRGNMYFSTGSHITEFYGKMLGGGFKNVLSGWQTALGRTSAIVSKMNKDVSLNVKKIDTLADNPQTQKALYQLMGESTRLGIYPDRAFEDQTWLKPSDRAAYNNLVALYNKPGISEVYDKLLAHTRRDFDMSYGSLLKTLAFTFEAPRELWSKIDPLMALSEDASVRKNFEDQIQVTENWLSQHEGSDASNALISMKEFRAARLQGPYFHLGRYGDFFVRYSVNDPIAVQNAMDKANQFNAFEYDVKSSIMNRFEQESQWTTQVGLLRKLQDDGAIEGLEVGKIEENLSALDSNSPSFMQNMLTRISADTRIAEDQKQISKELIRRIFVEMMPEVSGGKRLARRKGVPGYDVDMRRSFVKKASATAYLVAHNTVRPEVMESIQDMRFELNKLKSDPTQDVKRIALANDVFNHMKRRMDNAMQPLDTPMLDKFSSLGYSMFLASNVPYILTNLLQPMQVGLPVIGGRHGFTKTASEMFKSSRKAAAIIKESIQDGWNDAKSWTGILDAHISINRADLSDGERKAMHAFVDSGNLEFTQAHGLGRIERGEAEGWNTVAKTAGAASHYSEALNRISIGLTAFNLEFGRLKKQGMSDADATQRAIAYGMSSIVNTQFNYDPENRALAFSKRGIFGELTPLFTGFMQFNVQMLQLLSSLVTQAFSKSSVEKADARKALAGLTATTIMLAGALGLPGVTLLASAYGSLAGDEDDPRDFRLDVVNFLSDMLGADAANIIAHGSLDRVTGGTFSTRLSLADIVPFSQFLADRRDLSDRLESGALAMLGPSVGAAANILQGAAKFLDGDIYKGMAMMLPAALQGPVKAADLIENGFTTSKGSSLPIKPDGWDVFLQALNITPSIKTELQRNIRSFSIVDSILDARKTDLSRKMADALEKGDFDSIQKIGAEMVEFQIKNPDRGVFDPDRILKQRLKKTDTAVISGTGVTAEPRDMARLLQMLQGSTTTNLKERLNNELQLR